MGEIHSTLTPVFAPSVDRVISLQKDRELSLDSGRSQGMDEIREFLDAARDKNLVAGHFRGLLHIVIGRRVTKTDGTAVSNGLTWRELAGWLKTLRFDRELVRELGANPDELAPRDRERFWYSAIAVAKVDSPEAVGEAETLIGRLKAVGYVVGPAPAGLAPALSPARSKPAEPKGKPAEPPPAKRKKK